MRIANEKEKAFIASIRYSNPLSLTAFVCGGLLLAGLVIMVSIEMAMFPLGVLAAVFLGGFYVVTVKRLLTERREIKALIVDEISGPIEKVVRGKGDLVFAIHIGGVRYVVLDAEPVSAGTKVKIAFLPRSRRIVVLERIYNL